jgi:hypothetical protein
LLTDGTIKLKSDLDLDAALVEAQPKPCGLFSSIVVNTKEWGE